MAGRLSAMLETFIAEHVQSVHQLELLLFLRARPADAFGDEDLVHELRLGRGGALKPLELLRGHGLLERTEDGAFRYKPSSPEVAATIDELAKVYAERPVAVIDAIYASPPSSVRAFADAFKLKG